MPDKAPKDCTLEERRAMYAKVKCAPATDREARKLERVLWLFREMPRIKPQRVLEIGCESGFITRWMVDEPYLDHLHGIDPCEFSIQHAIRLVQKRDNPKKACYEVMGWEELQNAKAKRGYNSVVCFEVIEHFTPDEGVELIKKTNAVMERGGTAFLCTPSFDGRYGAKNPDPWHLKIYTRDELVELIRKTTGTVPAFEDVDPDFTMLKWRKRS